MPFRVKDVPEDLVLSEKGHLRDLCLETLESFRKDNRKRIQIDAPKGKRSKAIYDAFRNVMKKNNPKYGWCRVLLSYGYCYLIKLDSFP